MQYSPLNHDMYPLLLLLQNFRYEDFWEGGSRQPREQKPGLAARLWKWLRGRFTTGTGSSGTGETAYENVTQLPAVRCRLYHTGQGEPCGCQQTLLTDCIHEKKKAV